MRDTWYVLEDGRIADPREVTPAASGRLVHSSGVLVAMRGDVPSSRGVDVEEERAKAAAAKAAEKVVPEPVAAPRGYSHREMKRGR